MSAAAKQGRKRKGPKGSKGEASKGGEALKPRKVIRAAKDIAREARSILKKKRKKLSEPAKTGIEEPLEALTALLPAKGGKKDDVDLPALSDGTRELDEALSRHAGRFRKSVAREYLESIAWAIGLALVIRALLIEAFSIPSGSMIPTLEIGDHLFVNKIGYGLYVPFSTQRAIEWSQPDPGDIIVFEFEKKGDPNDGEDFIKRVVGVPGDKLRLVDNVLEINGEKTPTEVFWEGTCQIYDESERPIEECPCTRQWETLGETTFVTQHMKPGGRPFGGCQNDPNWPGAGGGRFGSRATNEDWPYVVVPEGHVFVMGDNRDRSKDGRYWGFVRFDQIKGKAFVIWYARNFSRIFTWLN